MWTLNTVTLLHDSGYDLGVWFGYMVLAMVLAMVWVSGLGLSFGPMAWVYDLGIYYWRMNKDYK